MKNLLRFTILIAFMAACAQSWAQAQFELLPPRTVVEGNKFSITFRLTNGEGSYPQAPEIENCKLLYGPSTSTMQSTQIIGNQMTTKTTIDYTFTYAAEKASTVTIPAVSVRADGKTLTSKTAQLTILPPDQSGQSQRPSAMGGGVSAPSSDKKFSPEDMFVRISLSKSSVYEQEPVVATVKLYTLYNISSFRITTQPTFEGFLSEELNVNTSAQMEHYNGKNYYTAVLKQCIVYPQKSGTLTVTSGKYDVTLVDYELVSNGFFQTRRPVERQVVTQSNNATLHVMPLPTPQPAGFNGAVGNYRASVEMKPLELRTNEAASYIFKIEGTGNIKYLSAPKLNLPPGIDQFTPKTDIDASFTGSNMRGTYQVNYTLVPQEPGMFEIPPMQFAYFDPSDKEYHTIDLQGFDMKVAQGASTSAITEQKSIATGMTDIRHIKAAAGTLVKNPKMVFHSGMYWALYIVLACALVAVAIIYRRRLKLDADVQGRKLARAAKQAQKRFKQARAAMSAHDAEKFYAELNQAMSGYLSDKLGIPASQLVRDNIAAQLSARGMSEADIDQTIGVLDECEMARFTPQHSEQEMSSLYDQAVKAVKAIESSKK